MDIEILLGGIKYEGGAWGSAGIRELLEIYP
jgi:hypothetical protein